MKKIYIIVFIILNLNLQVFGNTANEPCGIEDPIINLPWMQTLIDSIENKLGYLALACFCNGTITQYCLNNEVYFDTTPLTSNCAGYLSFVYDVEGDVICTRGGFIGRDCYSIFPGLWNDAELVGTVWSCNENCGCREGTLSPVCGSDGNIYRNECFATCASISVEKEGACNESLCNDFTFMNTSTRCEQDCANFLEFELTGGDGNYTVENGGVIVNNGDPVVNISPGNYSANLTAIDGNGCLAEVAIPAEPCSDAPRLIATTNATCLGNGLFNIGVHILGDPGNYQLDSIGEVVVGSPNPGELLYIVLSSKTFMGRVKMINLENGCTTNASLRLRNPDCPGAIPPQTGTFNCEE